MPKGARVVNETGWHGCVVASNHSNGIDIVWILRDGEAFPHAYSTAYFTIVGVA